MSDPLWILSSKAVPTWNDAQVLCEGMQTVWTDITRVGEGPIPDEPPFATHLWGWTDRRMVRIRIDRDRYWAAMLSSPHDGSPEDGRLVSVTKCESEPWGSDSRTKLADRRRFVLYEARPFDTVDSIAPTVFVREVAR